MRQIEIKKLGNGSHNNRSGIFSSVPDGWAVIPDNLETKNFPFGDIEVEKIDGIMVVTKWTAGKIPEPTQSEPEPTAQDDVDAMLIDHEYRLTLLELGINE